MRDLIVFGEDFGGLPSSTQHLILCLAENRKVLWINSIGLRQPKLNRNDFNRAVRKLFKRGKKGFSDIDHASHRNIYVANLMTIPAPRSWLARKLAQKLLIAQLKPLIEKYSLDQPILWSSLPTTADLCGHLGESSVVYYCGDDFSALAGVDHATVADHEKKLIRKSDLILAASAKLTSKFPQSKTHYLPHGVSHSLFSTDISRAEDLPNSPLIAGFYGSLSNWIDYPLLEEVCLQNPHWQFVFIGPIELESNPLPKLNNVHYLGPKAHNELPRYSQHWNVGLLPFKANQQIAACNPLKLLEYLSAGCHVISTPFPAISSFKNHIDVVNSADEFTRTLTQLETKNIRPNSAVELIEKESWHTRAKQVDQWLEAL